jgi:hypothetical protein
MVVNMNEVGRDIESLDIDRGINLVARKLK